MMRSDILEDDPLNPWARGTPQGPGRAVPAPQAILVPMGLNPYRAQRRRRSDYLFVVAAVIISVALLSWALVG